jgi:hypothetical protein
MHPHVVALLQLAQNQHSDAERIPWHPHLLCCRWEVFICTTAEKEYAMEAWRLLDPDYSIFKRDELLMKRMLCVPHPQKKDLLNVLRQVCTADSCFSVH